MKQLIHIPVLNVSRKLVVGTILTRVGISYGWLATEVHLAVLQTTMIYSNLLTAF